MTPTYLAGGEYSCQEDRKGMNFWAEALRVVGLFNKCVECLVSMSLKICQKELSGNNVKGRLEQRETWRTLLGVSV